MLQYHEIEQLAFERHAALLAASEREQLLKLLPASVQHQGRLGLLRHWMGSLLVQWGMRLQGADPSVTPEASVGRPCVSLSMQ